MAPYLLLKHSHKGLAYLSIFLFAARGGLMLADRRELLAKKPMKIVPMVIDTLLLACAISLVAMGGWSLASPWLLAKFAGLIAYVVLGVIALRVGKTKPVRAAALVGGLLVAGYIVMVAKTKMVVPF